MVTPRWLTKDTEQAPEACFGVLFANPNLFGVNIEDPASFTQNWSNVLTTVVLKPGSGTAPEIYPHRDLSRSVIYQCYAQAYKCAVEDLDVPQLRTAEAVSELRRKVGGFATLAADWDREGAEPVSVETIDTSLQVIEHIAIVLERKNTVSTPSVRPFPDGSVFFKWIHGQKELAITVEGRRVEAQRWEPLNAFHSQGLWEISADGTSEHVDWVLT